MRNSARLLVAATLAAAAMSTGSPAFADDGLLNGTNLICGIGILAEGSCDSDGGDDEASAE